MRVLAWIAGLLTISSGAALADPWKDESGKGKWRGGYERHGGYGYGGGWDDDRKLKMRTADGCEVERKLKKGEYEEKVKCKPGRYGYRY